MKYIPSTQCISPFAAFHKWNIQANSIFPFNQRSLKYFYFARNGIYYLGKRLKEAGYKKVLFPAYNHGNEIKALLSAGLELNYYRVQKDTGIDFEDVEKKLNKESDKIAFYFIHYVGFPQDIDYILELKKKYDMILIEDNALGLFSLYHNIPLGSFGDASIFCLYKSLPIPDGGLIWINNPVLNFDYSPVQPNFISTFSQTSGKIFDWADLNWHGMGRKLARLKSHAGKILNKMDIESVPVMDSNFDTTKADWTISKISQFFRKRANYSQIIETRKQNYVYMHNHLPQEFHLFQELPEGVVPWFFPVLIKDREKVFIYLQNKGVDCARFWRISHPDIPIKQFPEVQFLRETVLELPIHQSLGETHLKYVVEQFFKALQK
jgi:hypothetical protein